MHSIFSFLLISLLTATATLLPDDEVVFQDDEIVLDNDSTLDLSSNVETITEETETIGGQEVALNQEVTIVSSQPGETVSLANSDLTTVSISIPDQTTVKAPSAWNGEITPPTQIVTSGSVSSGFQTPTTSIQVGSPDVILVFDEAVTILLSGTTGQTAYKSPGTSTWILISGCTGTYAAPDDPPTNGECSISNGIDTKIVTFHFTEFTGLAATPDPTPAPSTAPSTSSSGKSGGSGRTGVGPSSGGGTYSIKQTNNQIPDWFSDVLLWQKQGLISAQEMLQAWKWLMAQ